MTITYGPTHVGETVHLQTAEDIRPAPLPYKELLKNIL